MKLIIAALTLCSLLLSNCATIVSSRQVPTAIDSSPSKMAFKVVDHNGVVVAQGVTPSTATLNRSSGYFRPGKYTIEISKNGKVVGKETVSAGINGWYFGNILLGGLIGMVIVDPLSGAMYQMPENVMVSTASMTAFHRPVGNLQIVDIASLTSSQRSKLVRI